MLLCGREARERGRVSSRGLSKAAEEAGGEVIQVRPMIIGPAMFSYSSGFTIIW